MKKIVNALLNPIINKKEIKFCPDIVQYAHDKGWNISAINEARKLSLKPPKLYCRQYIQTEYQNEESIEEASQYLICIPNASIKIAFVSVDQGVFIPDTSEKNRYFLEHPASKRRFSKHHVKIEGDCYFTGNVFCANYGHWLTDDMPRLMAALPHLPLNTKFIVEDPIIDQVEQSLKAIGITSKSIIRVKPYFKIFCERLWHITSQKSDLNWNQKNVFESRTALRDHFFMGTEKKAQRIFISRNNLRAKRLSNEEEILPVLQSYGFQINHAEQKSLEEQIKIFSQAEFIIGAYGSGLINMLFSNKVKILELQDPLYGHRPWHWRWATMLGHDYSCLFGPMSDLRGHVEKYGPVDNWKGYLDTSFRIEPADLKKTLDVLLNSPPDSEENP